MQAGFPAAPQAPVATQPRQMVQPLPTGAERTPVVVPQFNAALSNVMMNRGSTDQATVPAAQSAASEADVPDAIPRVTAPATSKAVPMAGLQAPSLDPPSGAEPAARSIAIATSKTEFVDRPGPLRQSSAKQIGPSEIPAGQGLISTQPLARNPATVPQAEKSASRRSGSGTGRGNGDDATSDRGNCALSYRSQSAAGARGSGACDHGRKFRGQRHEVHPVQADRAQAVQSRRIYSGCSKHARCGVLVASDDGNLGAKGAGPSCSHHHAHGSHGHADCRVCRDEPFAWCDGNGHRSARNRVK